MITILISNDNSHNLMLVAMSNLVNKRTVSKVRFLFESQRILDNSKTFYNHGYFHNYPPAEFVLDPSAFVGVGREELGILLVR